MARLIAAITAIPLLALLATCSGPSTPDPGPRLDSGDTPAPTTSALVELTNAERRRAGRAALRLDAQLTRAAQLHAEQMAAAGLMAHTLDDARYPRMEDRLEAAGYTWRAAGENLAFGQQSAAGAVEVWMQSPSHRANALNPEFTEAGAAHIADDSGRQYYVAVFARPMNGRP